MAAGNPIFQSSLTAAIYDVGATAAPLDGTAISPDGGTITYQWYSSADGSVWEAISNANSATYLPATNVPAKTYYRVAATNTKIENFYPQEDIYPSDATYPYQEGTATTATLNSNAALIEVLGASVPVFTGALVSASYPVGDTAAELDGTATALHGTMTYQWYSSPDGSTWTAIEGATAAKFPPPTSAGGKTYYKVRATNVVGTEKKTAESNTAVIEILTAEKPTFTHVLSDATYNQGDVVASLDGTATAPNGRVEYQWYTSVDGSTWAEITGETKAFFTPPNDAPYARYYRVIAKNIVGTSSSSSESGTAKITVYGATVPTITEQPQSVSYIEHGIAEHLIVQASAPRGMLQYQWQKSDGGTVWTNMADETSNSYLPPTDVPGIFYYRVVVTNTVGTSIATVNSRAAVITVVAAQIPVFDRALPESVQYSFGVISSPLDGTARVSDGGILTYQWYAKRELDTGFHPITGATKPAYRPPTILIGKTLYYVIVKNTLDTSVRTAQSRTVEATVIDTRMSRTEKLLDYRRQLRTPFTKLCRLRFLQPDGSTAFALDNNARGRYGGAFIADGTITVNRNNGKRRRVNVTLSNLDGAFDYSINKVWFGDEIALDEGLVLSDGTDFYIQQGIFLAEDPVELVNPHERVAQYSLVDKWANLDGTLFGNLESTYEVPVGTNIFQPITAILALDRGNGEVLDAVTPVFTEYYNGKTQDLPDGSTAALSVTPYTLRIDSDDGTYGDVCLGLAEMLAAWIGYDADGALHIDPSQDDILDSDKPLAWQFSQAEAQLLGTSYTEKNTEVYNDFIVIGEAVNSSAQVAGRAQNLDPASDTNVMRIGRKTKRYRAAGYSTKQQCEDLAVWKLKRSTALQKAVTISCSQILHISENEIVTIVRTDKQGSPVERHLVQGFTRPLCGRGQMQITAVSVNDFPTATVAKWPE